MGDIIKEVKIVEKDHKWYVVSYKKDKKGKYRSFGCYDSEVDAKKRLGQLYFFRKQGTIDTIISIANELDSKGKLHLSDKVSDCLKELLDNYSGELKISSKFAHIMSELKKEGQLKLNYQIDSIIPDIVALESGTLPEFNEGLKKRKTARTVCAEKAYFMANTIYNKYLNGYYDQDSFEMSMFARLKSMLKMGFVLESKTINRQAIDKYGSWWEYFTK
jgi:Cu2+-containing amine oxidase